MSEPSNHGRIGKPYLIDTAPKDGREFYIIIRRDWVHKGYVGWVCTQFDSRYGCFITQVHSNDTKFDTTNPDIIGWVPTFHSAERLAKQFSTPRPTE